LQDKDDDISRVVEEIKLYLDTIDPRTGGVADTRQVK